MTAGRALLAVAVAVAVATDRFGAAVIVLMIAWLTDFLDGIVARRARGATRLGDWDFRVDVLLGLALLIGLAIAGYVAVWLAIVATAVGVGWTWATGNPAPAMLLLALAYGWFLSVLLIDRPDWWWLPFAAMPLLLVLDLNRFFKVIMPACFNGLAGLSRPGPRDVPPVLDRWA